MFDSLFSTIQTYLDRGVSFLKENRVALFALIGLTFIIIVQFVALPLVNLNKSIARQEKLVGGQLVQVSKLAAEYDKLRIVASGAGPKKAGVNLFARLENLTRQLNVSGNVDFMRPSSKTLEDGRVEEEVYIRFKAILQKQFVDFLYSAEVEGGVVSVKHMRMKRDKQGRLDIDIIFTRVDG